MRNRLIGVLSLTSFLTAGAAFAADAPKPAAAPMIPPAAQMPAETVKLETKTGLVKSFDAKHNTLTLQDDSKFVLDKGLTGHDLKANVAVALTFKSDGEQKVVTQYKIVTQG